MCRQNDDSITLAGMLLGTNNCAGSEKKRKNRNRTLILFGAFLVLVLNCGVNGEAATHSHALLAVDE